MLWIIMRQSGVGPRLAYVLVMLAGLSGSNKWGVRPQMFTYTLFLVLLWVLLKWQDHKSTLLWLLPVLSLAWTNLHGSFILFFIIVGLALILGRGDRKQLLFVSLVSLAVSFIYPSRLRPFVIFL